jgi:hypothetical protein
MRQRIRGINSRLRQERQGCGEYVVEVLQAIVAGGQDGRDIVQQRVELWLVEGAQDLPLNGVGDHRSQLTCGCA